MSPREPGPLRRHEAFEELAVGYALHALEPEDEFSFTQHLAGCRACRDAVDSYTATLGEVARAVPAEEPPPSLLAAIRAGIGAPVGEPGDATGAGSGAGSGGTGTAGSAPADVIDLHRRRSSVQVRRSWLLSAAAAAVALLIGLGGYSVVLRNDRNAAAQRSDRLAAAVRTLERPGAQTVRLTGFDGRVRVVAVAAGGTMSLVVDGLAPNGPQSIYVLWGQTHSGAVRALSAFDVHQPGVDVVTGVTLSTPMADVTTLMVTHEKGRTPPPQAREPVLAAGSV